MNAIKRLLCFLGIHKVEYIQARILIGRCCCVNCGKEFIDTWMGPI